MNEKQKQIKIAQERLSESESEIISHIIVCELDDIDNETFVYNEEEVKNNICLLISIEDILEEEHVSLEKAIYKYVINCGEVSFDSEDTVKEIINHCIKNRKRIYMNYKKLWRRTLDSLSDVFEVRELARIEEELIQVDVDEIINSICNPHDFSTIPRRHSLLLEKEIIERELVKMGLKTLSQTLSECMRPYEDFPLEYCEYCKYNNHDPSVGIFNHCTRGDY